MRLKWIKLPCDIYFSPKLRLLGGGEQGGLYQLIYIYMLCLAGKGGADGALRLSSGKPYDAEMLARILDMDKATVEQALIKMKEVDLIKQTKGELLLLDWADTQFIEDIPTPPDEENGEISITPKRSLTSTQRVKKHRAKLKSKHLGETNETNETNETLNETQNETNETQNETNETLNETLNETNETLNETQRSVSSLKYLSLDKNKNKNENENENENISYYTVSEKNKEKETPSPKEEDELNPFLYFSGGEERNNYPFDNTRLQASEDIKESYGEMRNVRLTKTEYEEFKAEFPDDFVERIDELSLYMASSGKEYKDHFATLKAFSRRRVPPEVLRREEESKSGSAGFNCSRGYKRKEEKVRYGDFDPEEALQNAIERTYAVFGIE